MSYLSPEQRSREVPLPIVMCLLLSVIFFFQLTLRMSAALSIMVSRGLHYCHPGQILQKMEICGLHLMVTPFYFLTHLSAFTKNEDLKHLQKMKKRLRTLLWMQVHLRVFCRHYKDFNLNSLQRNARFVLRW